MCTVCSADVCADVVLQGHAEAKTQARNKNSKVTSHFATTWLPYSHTPASSLLTVTCWPCACRYASVVLIRCVQAGSKLEKAQEQALNDIANVQVLPLGFLPFPRISSHGAVWHHLVVLPPPASGVAPVHWAPLALLAGTECSRHQER